MRSKMFGLAGMLALAVAASAALAGACLCSGTAVAAVHVPRALRQHGYLVPHPARYRAAKRLAAKRVRSRPASGAREPFASLVGVTPGLSDASDAPPDTTDAIGTTRYIELVNTKFAIYDRASGRRLSRGKLGKLVGASRHDFLSDPQMIWDAGTNRFYYAEFDATQRHGNFIDVGFSKNAAPRGPGAWCKYRIPFGRAIADFPKLGDTADFVLVGVNRYRGTRHFLGADIAWMRKPPAGPRCPRSLKHGVRRNLETSAGRRVFAPTAANQIDSSTQGWIVATRPSLHPTSALWVYSVTKASTGKPAIARRGAAVGVPAYSIPPNAPQRGSRWRIDTADARLTQAVSAIDPTQPGGSATAIWTQHTVAGGGGSQVAWYEIGPATDSLFQTGVAADPSLFAFNGAISPDRAVNGASAAFGGSMGLVYNTSSAATLPAIDVVSKPAGAPQTAPTLVRTSSAAVNDRRCRGGCRWGDYSGATPDPVPPAGSSRIWMASQWQRTAPANGWRTLNFIVTP